MIDLVPDAFPEENVGETPEETEEVAEDIVTKRTERPGSLSQVVVEDVDEQAKDAADEERVAVAHEAVVVKENVIQDVVVQTPGASPKGYNQWS